MYEIDTGPVVIKEVFLRSNYTKHCVAEESAVQDIKKFTSGLLYVKWVNKQQFFYLKGAI